MRPGRQNPQARRNAVASVWPKRGNGADYRNGSVGIAILIGHAGLHRVGNGIDLAGIKARGRTCSAP